MKRITLLNKTYSVACPAGKEAELDSTVALLNRHLMETQNSASLKSRDDIIMMTALNLCHQILTEHNSD